MSARRRGAISGVLVAILVAAGVVSMRDIAQATSCKTRTGTITYHDLGYDIYSISETAKWCYTAGRFDSVSWSRMWNRFNKLWSWCDWQESIHRSGYTTDQVGKRTYWKTWYSRGCFHEVIPPFVDVYPDITLRIVANGDWSCTGHAFDGASKISCT